MICIHRIGQFACEICHAKIHFPCRLGIQYYHALRCLQFSSSELLRTVEFPAVHSLGVIAVSTKQLIPLRFFQVIAQLNGTCSISGASVVSVIVNVIDLEKDRISLTATNAFTAHEFKHFCAVFRCALLRIAAFLCLLHKLAYFPRLCSCVFMGCSQPSIAQVPNT